MFEIDYMLAWLSTAPIPVACRGWANKAMVPCIQGRGASKEWNYKN